MQARIQSKLWVDAHIRQCFLDGFPCFVTHKGDPERGGIILQLDQFAIGVQVFERATSFEGDIVWRQKSVKTSAEAAEIIKKRLAFDTDCWVIEMEDPKAVYSFKEPVESL